MTSFNLNQRKSIRIPTPRSRQEGELRFGTIRFQVWLRNQSADGFSVSARQAPGVQNGTKGLLRIGEDWYEIRLAHFSSLESSFTSDAPKAEDHEYVFRIGLQRLRDTYNPDLKNKWRSLHVFKVGLNRFRLSSAVMFIVGLSFVFFAVFLSTTGLMLIYHWKTNNLADSAQVTERVTAADRTEKDELASPANRTNAREDEKDDSSLADYYKELRKMIARTPGAAVFLMPNVIEELRLTDKQQEKIRDIIAATSAAMEQLRSQMNIANEQIAETVYQDLHNIARNSTLQLLTPEQRARWQKLETGKSQDKSDLKKN